MSYMLEMIFSPMMQQGLAVLRFPLYDVGVSVK